MYDLTNHTNPDSHLSFFFVLLYEWETSRSDARGLTTASNLKAKGHWQKRLYLEHWEWKQAGQDMFV